MVKDTTADTSVYKFPVAAELSEEGYVMPGWSGYSDDAKAAINWQCLRSAVTERYGLEFTAEG